MTVQFPNKLAMVMFLACCSKSQAKQCKDKGNNKMEVPDTAFFKQTSKRYSEIELKSELLEEND
jgi:hypothetical protein